MMPMMAFQNQLLAVDRATPFDRMGNEKISPMTTPGKQKRKKLDQLGNIIIFFFVSLLGFSRQRFYYSHAVGPHVLAKQAT